MKKIQNFILASAAATLLLTGCADDFDTSYQVDKPESVALTEALNTYDVLKKYAGIRIGAEMAMNDAATKNTVYGLVLTNFSEVSLSDAFSHATLVGDEGVIDTASVEDAVKNAAAMGLEVFGTPMFSPSQYNFAYMKQLTKDTWVDGTHEEKDVVEDFESYNVGDKLGSDGFSVIANDPKGQSGKVFSNTKAVKYMTIPVELPSGVTIKNIETISFDYYTTNLTKDLVCRLKAGSSVSTKNFGKPETKNVWAHYEIDLKKAGFFDAITEDDQALTSLELVIGQAATPQKVYVDNIKLHTSFTTEGYWAERPVEEKAADVKKGLDDYAKALVEKYGDQVKNWSVAGDLLDDLFGMLKSSDNPGEGTEFYPNDYLGDNYVSDLCKTIHAVKSDMKLFYSESNLLGNDSKQDGLVDMLAQWNGDGAKIEGINVKVDFPYTDDADALNATKEQYEALLAKLKETGLLVRLSDMNVYLADESGAAQNISKATTDQLKAMADFYSYIVSKYLEIIPASQQYGLSFSTINENSQYVGLWKNFNRLPTYVGVANGLQSKETVW